MASMSDIVININEFLRDEMPVFDSNQDKVGTVKLYDAAAGYFMVEEGVFNHTDLYIPFRLIRTIDPKEIFLKQSKDVLVQDYTQPPAATTITEPHNGHLETAQVLSNGFDARPIIVHRVDVQMVGQELRSGMGVYDVEGDYIGTVVQFDSTQAMLTVEKGVFSPKDLFIPFSLIQEVYPSSDYLTLTLPKDVLKKDLGRYTQRPTNE